VATFLPLPSSVGSQPLVDHDGRKISKHGETKDKAVKIIYRQGSLARPICGHIHRLRLAPSPEQFLLNDLGVGFRHVGGGKIG
jgi:hypothetical protein